MKVLKTKTVDHETIRNAFIKYFNDARVGVPANKYARAIAFCLSQMQVGWNYIMPDHTEIIKVKEGYYKVKGKFAEDYLK